MSRLKTILELDAAKQQQRLEKLYGPGNYNLFLKKTRKKTIYLYVTISAVFIILLLAQIIGHHNDMKQVQLDENGYISSVDRPAKGQSPLVIEATPISETGGTLDENNVSLVIQPESTKEKDAGELKQEDEDVDGTAAQAHEIRKTVYRINADDTAGNVKLPQKLDNGVMVRWKPMKQGNSSLLFLLTAASFLLIFRTKDAELAKKEKEAKETVIRELPEFVNKLVLLLNAGLILTNAFNKIVQDYQKTRGGENNYFYDQLKGIMTNLKDNNSSLQQGIRDFAVRSGVVEFMRLSNIISDSLTKGSDLMTQLKMEGDSLWIARRKQTEEKGKIAETKLTFPLVILLLVLVMITIAPAIMEM